MKKIALLSLSFFCVVISCSKQAAPETGQAENAGAGLAENAARTEQDDSSEITEAAGADGEPSYFSNLFGGGSICEFAENGIKNDEMEYFRPYLHKGRLYFICPAAAVTGGNLKRDSEFLLWDDTYKIRGKYRGNEKFPVEAGTMESGPWLVVAGYAEPGKITVTRVFPDSDASDKFSATVKTFGEITF